MSEEYRDLYDNQKQKTEKTIKSNETIPNGKYILVVTAFIVNSNNELLIQKRSKEKGGKYGFLSGHPKAGETSIEGMLSEIKEEIGVKLEEKDLKLIHSEKGKNSFFDFYFIKNDINLTEVTLQVNEVDSVQWLSISEVFELVENNSFFEKQIEAIPIIEKYLL